MSYCMSHPLTHPTPIPSPQAILPPRTTHSWVLRAADHSPTPSSSSDTPPNAMDALNARLDKLRQTQAHLDAQQHPAPAQPNPAPVPNPIKLSKPQTFEGTRGTVAKVFVAQISLHAITYLECFPTDTSKVAFATSFMGDYAANWCQPYLNWIFNGQLLQPQPPTTSR
ncbi:uncharacterized protein VP01_10951g1, partial [Puccinia sorghi]